MYSRTKELPSDEKFCHASQIGRVAVLNPARAAKGTELQSDKELLQSLAIAHD
ncbi:MAG: four helix bundle protein [Pyrinomonadaceae bacterium]|nr:four helix bundle protein [Pyrinomonadaceae bacterium]